MLNSLYSCTWLSFTGRSVLALYMHNKFIWPPVNELTFYKYMRIYDPSLMQMQSKRYGNSISELRVYVVNFTRR